MIQRLRALWADDEGLGLVEVLVAITLMSVLLTSVAFTLTKQMSMQRDSRAREVGLDVAAQAIDAARAATDFSSLSSKTWTDSINGESFTITQTVTTYLQNSSGSPCDGTGSSSVAYKSISIAVRWTGMSAFAAPVRSQTLLSPSVTSYDPTLGNLAVKVRDGSGAGVEGAQVVTTGPSGTVTTYSDGAGCAFVDQRTPGSYTATASLAGYVTPEGLTAPSKSVTVQAAQTVAVAFELGVTATLTLTLPNGDYPPISSVPITLGNTSLVPSGRLTVAGTGTTRTLTNRFPYQSGYTVWTGSCDDADPEGAVPSALTMPANSPYLDVMSTINGGRYHPGVSRGAAVPALAVPNVNRGTVDMADVEVQVRNTANAAVAGAAVTMTHVPWDPATSAVYFPGCTAGETYALGTTTATGGFKVDVPYGYWDITSNVVGTTPVRVWLHPQVDSIVVVVNVP